MNEIMKKLEAVLEEAAKNEIIMAVCLTEAKPGGKRYTLQNITDSGLVSAMLMRHSVEIATGNTKIDKIAEYTK